MSEITNNSSCGSLAGSHEINTGPLSTCIRQPDRIMSTSREWSMPITLIRAVFQTTETAWSIVRTVLCSICLPYGTEQYGTVQSSPIQSSSIEYNIIQCSSCLINSFCINN
jgi:hypothetical protein